MRNIIKISLLTIFLFTFYACQQEKVHYFEKGKELFDNNLADKEELKEAEKYFRKHLEIHPNYFENIQYLAMTISHLDKRDEAIKMLEATRKKNRVQEYISLMGIASYKFIKKDYSGSLDACNEALKISKEDTGIYKQMVMTKLFMNFSDDWNKLTKDDIKNLITEIYPKDARRPTVDEFNGQAQKIRIELKDHGLL